MSEFQIRRLTPERTADYFDFFDHRAFADGSPYYPCYCNAFNMTKDRIQLELFDRAQAMGGGDEAWKRALRESAARMVANGEVQGYLAYDGDLAVGWCNANDRLSYARVGEFDLADVPEDAPGGDLPNRGEIKSVVCFEIAPEYRGKGLATRLLEQVCADARAEGYRYVEGYPMKDESDPGLAFPGPRRLYEKVGFHIAGRRGNALVMQKELTDRP